MNLKSMYPPLVVGIAILRKKKKCQTIKKKKKMEFYSFVEGSIIVEKADSISKYKGAKQRGRKNVICNSVSFFFLIVGKKLFGRKYE